MKNNDQTAITTVKPKRNKYTPQFKEQALERAKQDGVPKAAKDYYDFQSVLGKGKRAAEQIAEHTALVTEGTLESTRQLMNAMEFLVQPSMSKEHFNSAEIKRNLLDLKIQNLPILIA